jgi:hypothetical protein
MLWLIELLDSGDDAAGFAVEMLIEYLEQQPVAMTAAADESSEDVVSTLIEYLQSSAHPNAGAVWALSKSRDVRVEAALTDVLRRFMRSEDEYEAHIAFQALVGLKAVARLPLNVFEEAAVDRRRVTSPPRRANTSM